MEQLFRFRAALILSLLFSLYPGFAVATPTVTHALEVSNVSKAGLAWPNGNTVDISQYEGGKISWYYSWSAHPANSTLEFVPMFWGLQSSEDFNATIQQTLSDPRLNVTALLGMNEPEQPGQSNITAQQGVDMWKTYVQPFNSTGLRLGSPATSSGPSGKIWLQDFLTLCGDDCTVDFIALHWYGTNASQFIAYVEDFHNTFNKTIWVTEWACQNFVDFSAQCSDEDVRQFLNATQSYLDNATFVERYSWFGAMKDMQGVNEDNALMGSNGSITSLGKQYAGMEGVDSQPIQPVAGLSSASQLSFSPIYLATFVAFYGAMLTVF
ncbi:hypothetical protein CPC08DRAFT_648661 [Agrocybe pediades]|nr:hypothetical protein CPC08DRAFT_648661 [Agrocybe pediades]